MEGKTTMVVIMVLTMMAMLGIGVSAMNIGYPVADPYITGNDVWFVVNSSGGDGLTACNLTLASTHGANTTTITVENDTCHGDGTNCTFGVDSTTIADGSNYTVSATCSNTSGTTETGSATSQIVDNTAPGTANITYPDDGDEIKNSKHVMVNATINSPTVTGCWVQFISGYAYPGARKLYWVNDSESNVCYGYWGKLNDGVYRVVVSASDDLNISTNSSIVEFIVDAGSTSSGVARVATLGEIGIDEVQIGDKTVPISSLFGQDSNGKKSILPWVIIFGGLYLVFRKKPTGKRK